MGVWSRAFVLFCPSTTICDGGRISMNERVHQYLDGELLQEALTLEELQEIAPCEALVKETQESYRSIKVPDLTARIMLRIPDGPAPRRGLKQSIQNAVG